MSFFVSTDIENGVPSRPDDASVSHRQETSVGPVFSLDEQHIVDELQRSGSFRTAHPSRNIQPEIRQQTEQTLTRLYSVLKQFMPTQFQADELETVQPFDEWCSRLYNEGTERNRPQTVNACQPSGRSATIAERVTTTTHGFAKKATRRPQPAYCLFLCWPGSVQKLVVMTAVPIQDPQDEAAVFECLQKKCYEIHGRWKSYIPFWGVIEVKEVKVSPSYPEGKLFRAELDELDLIAERTLMKQKLESLNDEVHIKDLFDCECYENGDLPSTECDHCTQQRLDHVLKGIPKLSQLVTCFHNPQYACGRGLLKGLLYMHRGQPLSLLHNINSSSGGKGYLDSYVTAYLVRTGWHKPRTWPLWSLSTVVLTAILLPFGIALSRLTDHQVGVGQLTIGVVSLVFLFIFRLPQEPLA